MWNSFKTIVNSNFVENICRIKSSFLQQTRNTYILKRRWDPGLQKQNGRSRKLRGRHYVYDLVDDTNLHKQEPMSIILTSYVEGLGVKGDVVSVKPHFAYNKLLLPKLGVYYTPENIEKYVSTAKDTENVEHSSPYAAKTQFCLEHLLLNVVMNKYESWIIEPWHIKACFRKAGYHVAEYAITLPEKSIKGPDLSIQGKEFYVTVAINKLEKVNVRCRIHHWSKDPHDRLPYVSEFWKQRAEPIFPEQKAVLDALPNQFVDREIEENY